MSAVKDFFSKYWIAVLAVVLLTVTLVIVYYAVLSKGKQSGVNSILADIPNPSTDEPYTDDELKLIRRYTDMLIDDNSWYKPHNSNLWDDLAKSISDRVLIGCYEQYRKDTGNDLISVIEGSFSLNPFVVDNTKAVVARLKNLI